MTLFWHNGVLDGPGKSALDPTHKEENEIGKTPPERHRNKCDNSRLYPRFISGLRKIMRG